MIKLHANSTIQSLCSAHIKTMSSYFSKSSINHEDFGIIPTNTIDLQILCATNLRKAEISSESDPYVKVEIVGRTCKCNEKKLRTETVDNNHSPFWNK